MKELIIFLNNLEDRKLLLSLVALVGKTHLVDSI